MRFRCAHLFVAVLVCWSYCLHATADVVVTGFFSGTVERFAASTGQQSTLATIASAADPFPGLSGIAFDPLNNLLYTSARISNRLYRLDATTGSVLGFWQMPAGSSPAGVTTDALGNVYVANNGGNTVSVYNSAGVQTGSINLPNVGLGDNLLNGLAFDTQNRLVISTFAGAGLFRYDPASSAVVSLAASPLANGQVAIGSSGDIFVGSAAFSSAVQKFDATGTALGSPLLTIDTGLLPQPLLAYASPDFTSPSGVAIDAEGNLIVAALGRTNPTSAADNFQSNGGLWKFSADGRLLQTYGTNLTPLSSVTTISVVPEPGMSLFCCALGCGGLFVRNRRTQNGPTT